MTERWLHAIGKSPRSAVEPGQTARLGVKHATYVVSGLVWIGGRLALERVTGGHKAPRKNAVRAYFLAVVVLLFTSRDLQN